MPNWCENEVKLYGDVETIKTLKAQLESDETVFDFNKVLPIPEALKNVCVGAVTVERAGEPRRVDTWREVDGDVIALDKTELIAQYGAVSARDWCINNWGTKWNTSEVAVEEGEDYLHYYFDTAWCPPTGICTALRKQFPDLHISWFYREDGEQLAGYL